MIKSNSFPYDAMRYDSHQRFTNPHTITHDICRRRVWIQQLCCVWLFIWVHYRLQRSVECMRTNLAQKSWNLYRNEIFFCEPAVWNGLVKRFYIDLCASTSSEQKIIMKYFICSEIFYSTYNRNNATVDLLLFNVRKSEIIFVTTILKLSCNQDFFINI